MREILFRGKSTINEEWVYGFYQEYPKGYVHIQNDSNDWFPVLPETVCQYTGLTDKNGRKIFEGDIVKTPLFTPDVMAIGFIDGAFCLVDSKKEYIADIHYVHHAGINQTNIIGNIFDNPELIGEQP